MDNSALKPGSLLKKTLLGVLLRLFVNIILKYPAFDM